jgi:hypothetical protein
MTCQTFENNTYFDGSLECDGSVHGTTTGRESHAYTFSVPEPGVWNLEFNSCGSGFDTHLQVVGGERYDEVLTGCDDCGPCDNNAVLDTGFLPAGDYAVEIGSTQWFWSPQSSGAYSLTMSCFTDAADVTYYDGNAVCGQNITGDTTGAGSHRGNDASDHLYVFDIAEDGVSNIEFNSCGSEYDTHLRVLSHDMLTEVAACDDCGDCEFASILDTGGLDAGTYVLVVEGYSDTEGVYTVSTTCQNTTEEIQYFDGNVECGEVIEGDTLGEGSHRGHESGDHIYYFTVPEGAPINVEFDSCASDFDTHLRVFNHDLTGEYAECDDCGGCDNRAVLNVALDAGNYALLVEGYWYSEGFYRVEMICTSEAENSVTQYMQAYFLLLNGDTEDASGNGHSLTLSGHSHMGMDGAFFDGEGDDISISNFDYASDGTFSVSFWFTKEECTDSIYEYLYSHHESADPEDAFDLSFVNVYMGCESRGGGWSTLGGTVIRYFVKDTVGTEALFDFGLHSAGDYDRITNLWIHTIFTVSPTSLATYDDGQLVDDNVYGSYMSRAFADNSAMPYPYHLDPELVNQDESGQPTFDLQQDITIGGRGDRNVDRHFHGRMALVSVYSHSFTPAQAAFSYRAGAAQMEGVIEAEGIRELALLDVWFVMGENDDRSVYCHDAMHIPWNVPCHHVQAHGHTTLSEAGVSFDGAGDDVSIGPFDYYSDGTFTISYWFTKEACTSGLYEYLFSHHETQDPVRTWERSYVDSYLGCEQNGGGFGSLEGTVLRHWLRDASGTEAAFDYSLHNVGSFDEITNQWVHNLLTVSPTALAVYTNGNRVNDASFGFSTDMLQHVGQMPPSPPPPPGYPSPPPPTGSMYQNSAYPNPSSLSTTLSGSYSSDHIFNMLDPIFLGGRADRSVDRHFHGRMAMVRIYDIMVDMHQANVIFRDSEAIMLPLACDTTTNFVAADTFECTPFSVPPCECPDEYDIRCEYELMPRRMNGDRICDVVRQCDGTEEYEVAPPTLTSDRRCELHRMCTTDEYERTRGTATRDTVCEALVMCDPDTEYESAAPERRPCRHESRYCATSDRECTAISRPCDLTTEWEYLAPTATTDRVCRELTVCEGDEVEAVAPTSTSDRECSLPEGEVACRDGQYMADAGPPIYCRSIHRCSSHQFEVAAPTETSDRVCQEMTMCRRDEDEVTAPTLNSDGEPVSDRICELRVCTELEYDSGSECTLLTRCLATQYEDIPPEPDADRHCTDLTICTAGQYQASPPTTRRDRVCVARPMCLPGQVQAVGDGGELLCENCPAGTEDADSDPDTACTSCADGTSSVAGSTACSSTQFATVEDAFEIEGVVVPEDSLVAAVTEVVSSLDSEVTVEVVSYEQTVTTSLSIDGRPLSDFNTATPEGAALISELRGWIATTLGVPVDSIQLQTQRRRRQLRQLHGVPLRRALTESGPDKVDDTVELEVEVVADRDVTGRLASTSSFEGDLAEVLDLPSSAVTQPEEPQVTTRIVTRVNFEADDDLEGGGDRAAVSVASALLTSGGGEIVEDALRRQDPSRYENLELHAEESQVSFAVSGSIHGEGHGDDDVIVQVRPTGPGSSISATHELHDMDAELTIIEVFLAFLGVLCLCGCGCVCYYRGAKPKTLTDDDLDRGFGAVLGSSVGPVGDDMDMSDKPDAALVGGGGGGAMRGGASDHNPLVVRPGDDAQLMGTFENRLVARP